MRVLAGCMPASGSSIDEIAGRHEQRAACDKLLHRLTWGQLQAAYACARPAAAICNSYAFSLDQFCT
jgi:hypothetical protein